LSQFPETRESLLLRLADPADQEAWTQFTSIYRPLIYRVARRQGLQDADALEVVQRVLLSVLDSIDRWQAEPQRARFRTWLHTVARNAVVDHLRSVHRDAGEGGTTANLRLQGAADAQVAVVEGDWDQELQREVFRWAAREIRPEFEDTTWLAFWLSAVDGLPISTVADELGKSTGAVYIARSRVMQRFRDKVNQYESEKR
jgi:RNA polymerase sigma factor (sigma-70 family)